MEQNNQDSQNTQPQEKVTQTSPQQSVPSIASQPVSQSANKNGASTFIFIVLGIIVFLGVAGGSYYLGMQHSQKQQFVMQTKEPVHAFPTQTVNQTPTQITSMPTIFPTPTPDPTATWPTYTNTTYAFKMKYDGLAPKEVNSGYFYVQFDNINSGSSLPPILVSVIPETFIAKDVAAYNYMSSDWINNIENIAVGTRKTMDSAASFVRLPDTTIDGKVATVIEVDATGFKQHRVYVKNNGYIYMISNYYQSDSDIFFTEFNLFLSSFQFTQ